MEIVGFLAALQETPGEEIVRQHWRGSMNEKQAEQTFSDFWQTALHDGVIRDTATSPPRCATQRDWKST